MGQVCVGRCALTIAIVGGINPVCAATEDIWSLEGGTAKWK